MPRPPILPTVDWRALSERGKDYATWIREAENAENAQQMEALRNAQRVPTRIIDFLRAVPRPVHVIAIAEDWCGDVVRHAPVLARLAEICPNLRVRFVKREDSPEAFARFLTNGGEAIPKFVFLSADFVECGNWGPMPDACREYIARGKACGDVGAARQLVGAAYEADKDRTVVVSELARLIDIASSTGPDPEASLLAKLTAG